MSIPEIIWMHHNEDDINTLIPINKKLQKLIKPVNNLSSYLNNIRPMDNLNINLNELTKKNMKLY